MQRRPVPYTAFIRARQGQVPPLNAMFPVAGPCHLSDAGEHGCGQDKTRDSGSFVAAILTPVSLFVQTGSSVPR